MEIQNQVKNTDRPMLTISFNPKDKKEMELYNYLKGLKNTTKTIKEAMTDYKLKEENEALYLKNQIKEYMSTREFNNLVRDSMRSNELEKFISAIVEKKVEEELKTIKKLLK